MSLGHTNNEDLPRDLERRGGGYGQQLSIVWHMSNCECSSQVGRDWVQNMHKKQIEKRQKFCALQFELDESKSEARRSSKWKSK